jgi:uncharacterized membrane protein YoaK (UPF0700 family)
MRAGEASIAAGLAGVLTVATGATDAISFLRLGNVFTSVMTGNLVLLGLAAGRGNAKLAGHSGVALASFAVGVLIGARIAGDQPIAQVLWPRRVTVTMAVELIPMAGFMSGWAATGGRPSGWSQLALLGSAAMAMGMQSAAVRVIGITGLSTTYLTGTLTTALVHLGVVGRLHPRHAGLVAALVLGAVLGGLIGLGAPPYAAVLPFGLLALVFIAAAAGVAGPNKPPTREDQASP